MSKKAWMTPQLKHRIQIRRNEQTFTATGGTEQSFTTLATVWAAIKTVSQFAEYVTAVRGVQTDSEMMNYVRFIVRMESVQSLGSAFSSGFSSGVDAAADLNPVKADYYVFLQVGSSTVKGRLYRVVDTKRDDDRREWLEIRCLEQDERGTGYTE